MILSHRHRFLFVHCRKCAGSSCTVYLNRFLGPEDLQVGAWMETRRAGGRYNRRFWRESISPEGLREIAGLVGSKLCRGNLPKLPSILHAAQKRMYQRRLGDSPAHPTAKTLKQWAPREWETYFTFCFVRNPFSRLVSDYRWRTRSRQRDVSFSEFLARLADPDRPDPEGVVPRAVGNWPMYTLNDRIAVDFVGKVESLFDGMSTACERIGIPFDAADFPHAKSRQTDDTGYRTFYTDADVELASSLCRHEIESFDYQF